MQSVLIMLKPTIEAAAAAVAVVWKALRNVQTHSNDDDRNVMGFYTRSLISYYLLTTVYADLHITLTGGVFFLQLFSRVLSFIDMFTSVKGVVFPSLVVCLTGSTDAWKLPDFFGRPRNFILWMLVVKDDLLTKTAGADNQKTWCKTLRE